MNRSPIFTNWNSRKANPGTDGGKRRRLIYAGLLLLTVLLLGASVCAGSVAVPASEVIKCLLHRQGDEVTVNIVRGIRFPRALAAMILGGGLALSGYLLQTFFHNPIAGPFVLGISSGAKLAVAAVMIFFLGRNLKVSSLMLILAAFAGALLTMGIVLLLSQKVRQMSMLIVGGVMIGYICSAVTDLFITFAEDSDIVNLHNWSMGSFSGITWDNVQVLTAVILPVFAVVFLLAKPISAYLLGETYASNLGVPIKSFRLMLVLLSSLLSACVTAFAGPISFVGIAVPQLMQNLLKTSRPILLIPACFLGGSVFCLGCDLIARTFFAPTELSISTVTAIFGAPVVLWIMIRRKRQE